MKASSETAAVTAPLVSFPARVWLRLDALNPLSCSVRFVMVAGEGHLSWGAATAHDTIAAVRSGTAAGLVASDLAALVLSVRASDGQTWVPHPLHLRTLPKESRTHVGAWLELDVSTFGRDECSDLIVGFDLPDFEGTLETLEPLESPPPQREGLRGRSREAGLDPGAFDVPLVTITENLPSGTGLTPDPSKPGRGAATVRSSLVRALVQRIRNQEAELKTLRRELGRLRSRVGPSDG